ncbi:MAG: homocysteine S-methyltransferase family protein [Gemmatimonadota bacterium]|nr:MAG: homocysteine S-methyltransferase family protein [Gemmatimonadota bacterium]
MGRGASDLLTALSQRVLVGDGAMGTELQRAGLEPGGCGELWNLAHPDHVLAIQSAYVDAGSDCVTTNTFGASRVMLQRHGLEDQVEPINRAAVRVAREALRDRAGFVLGDIGPLGGLLEPYGDLSVARASDAFREQAALLVAAGVDAIIIETQTSLEELGIAITAAREAGAPCVIGSVAFDLTHDGNDMRTMMGTDPEAAARFMADSGADVLGANCGAGINMAAAAVVLRRFRNVSPLPTMAQPNAGRPELENFRAVYKESPQDMALGLRDVLDAGARVVGGCCGTTPDHIRRFRAIVNEWNAGQRTNIR